MKKKKFIKQITAIWHKYIKLDKELGLDKEIKKESLKVYIEKRTKNAEKIGGYKQEVERLQRIYNSLV